MARRVSYSEGDWFAVPLRGGGGYGVGRIARDAGPGGLLGYFFGPRRPQVPDLADLDGFRAEDALTVAWFGDLSLINGKWPLLGHEGWQRQSWPVPDFGQYDEISGVALQFIYEEPDLSKPVRQERVSREEAQALPPDGLLGAGAVELVLTDLIAAQE